MMTPANGLVPYSTAGPLLPSPLETAVWPWRTVGNFCLPLGRLRWGKVNATSTPLNLGQRMQRNWPFLLGLTTFYKEAWLHRAKQSQKEAN